MCLLLRRVCRALRRVLNEVVRLGVVSPELLRLRLGETLKVAEEGLRVLVGASSTGASATGFRFRFRRYRLTPLPPSRAFQAPARSASASANKASGSTTWFSSGMLFSPNRAVSRTNGCLLPTCLTATSDKPYIAPGGTPPAPSSPLAPFPDWSAPGAASPVGSGGTPGLRDENRLDCILSFCLLTGVDRVANDFPQHYRVELDAEAHRPLKEHFHLRHHDVRLVVARLAVGLPTRTSSVRSIGSGAERGELGVRRRDLRVELLGEEPQPLQIGSALDAAFSRYSSSETFWACRYPAAAVADVSELNCCPVPAAVMLLTASAMESIFAMRAGMEPWSKFGFTHWMLTGLG